MLEIENIFNPWDLKLLPIHRNKELETYILDSTIYNEYEYSKYLNNNELNLAKQLGVERIKEYDQKMPQEINKDLKEFHKNNFEKIILFREVCKDFFKKEFKQKNKDKRMTRKLYEKIGGTYLKTSNDYLQQINNLTLNEPHKKIFGYYNAVENNLISIRNYFKADETIGYHTYINTINIASQYAIASEIYKRLKKKDTFNEWLENKSKQYSEIIEIYNKRENINFHPLLVPR